MKKLISIIILVVFVGCSSNSELKGPNKAEVFEINIQRLNEKYKKLSHESTFMLQRNIKMEDDGNGNNGGGNNENSNQNEEDDTENLRVDGSEIVLNDLQGFLFGSAFSVWGPEVGLIAAVAVAATFSVATYYEQTHDNANAALYLDNTDLQSGGPETANKITNVDIRYPINKTEILPQLQNEIIGESVGELHNFAVTQLLYNTQYGVVSSNCINEIFTNTISLFEDYLYLTNDEVQMLSELEDEILATDLQVLPLNIEDFNAQLEWFEEYYEISVTLDSIMFRNYSQEYMEIVNDAYNLGILSYEEAFIINSSISIFTNSKILWNNYLPDNEYIGIRLAYDSLENKWHYCNKEYIKNSRASGLHQFSVVGIPHFVGSKLAEIYFYDIENEDNIILNNDSIFCDLNSSYEIHSPYNYLNIDSCMLYPNMYSVQPYIYHFTTIENSNGKIKYIKNY